MFDNIGNEFRGGVCGGTRWNIPATTPFGFSPCLATGTTDLEALNWDMKGIFSKSIDDDDEGDARNSHVRDSNIQMLGVEAMEDWRQTFGVNGCGGGGRSNQQSQIQQQEHMMMSSSFSNNMHDFGHQYSSVQPFKSFSIDTTTQEQDVTAAYDTPSSYGFSSTLLQTLFDEGQDSHQPVFENPQLPINYSHVVSPMPKRPFDPSVFFINQSPSLWNASSAVTLNDIRSSFFPSSSTLLDNLSCPQNTAPKVESEVSHGLSWGSSTKMNNNDRPPLKRSRMETPSPLPTFKVRKEKMGDRITALQQLVSPFGKTDTASVLHEAIDYIKFLHNQVNVLTSPYLRNGENMKNDSSCTEEGNSKKDLKRRGLCLVPLMSTIPVAMETSRAAEFWTPNLGGALR